MKRFAPLLPLLVTTACIVVERSEPEPARRPHPAPPPPATATIPAPVPVAQPEPPPAPTPPVAPPYAPAPTPVYAAPPPTTVVVVDYPPVPDGDIVVIYEDLLGRRPSERELRDWRERTRQSPMSANDVRSQLRDSREFRGLAPETVIRRAFRDFHHAEPDDEAMRYYRRRIIDEGWTAGQVRQSIAHRDEKPRSRDNPPPRRNDDRRDPHPRPIDEHELNSPDAIIERAYDDLLERKPDPVGRDNYRRMLQQGASEAQIRAKIKDSVEYRVTLPDSKTTRAYREVLGREPDPVGLEGFRHKLVDSGWTEEDVKNYLRQTDEYKRRKP